MGHDLAVCEERAAVPVDEWAPERNDGQGAESFEYLECPDAPFVPSWAGWNEAPDAASPLAGGPVRGEKPGGAELERRIAEELRQSFETGRARGIEEGRKAEREGQTMRLAQAEEKRMLQAATLLEEFAEERERYFAAVEPEVVRLALAVAGRILRREASSDPLLLMGAVRAALGQISGSTEVRLRVPSTELDLWTEAIALLPNLTQKPAVLAGEGMTLGDCRIETALGTADLGVRAQLAEMERALLGNAAAGRHGAQPPRGEPAAARAESAA